MREPDRFYIAEGNRVYVEQMENRKFLNANNLTRKEIFFLAMSLGLKSPTEIKGKSDGFFLAKDLNPSDKSIIYACYLAYTKDIDSLTDKVAVFKYAEESANTGFLIIKDYLEYDEERILELLMSELDSKFENKLKKLDQLNTKPGE